VNGLGGMVRSGGRFAEHLAHVARISNLLRSASAAAGWGFILLFLVAVIVEHKFFLISAWQTGVTGSWVLPNLKRGIAPGRPDGTRNWRTVNSPCDLRRAPAHRPVRAPGSRLSFLFEGVPGRFQMGAIFGAKSMPLASIAR